MKDKKRTLQLRKAREIKEWKNSYFGSILLAEALSLKYARERQMQAFAY